MNNSRFYRARAIDFLAVVLLSLTLGAGTALAAQGVATASQKPDSTNAGTNPSPVTVADHSGPAKAVSAVIDGGIGGELKWGRFRLAVPPGAWYGKATVTLVVPNPSVLLCELEIDPPSANGFSIPVVLSVNSSNAASDKGLQIGWFDPSLRKWAPVSGSWHAREQKRVLAPLYHFSTYGVFVEGRAGW